MEAAIFMVGAVVFGVVYALLKPHMAGPWLVAPAVVYFGLLRLIGHLAAKNARRKLLLRAQGKQE